MLRHPDYTRARLAETANRLHELIYPEGRQADSILISPRVDRISHDEARTLPYREVSLGEQLGPLWSTFWVDVRATVPEAWSGQRVDLNWVSHSEATLWIDGRPIQGLNSGSPGERTDAVIVPHARGGDQLRFQVEVACNGMFGTLDHPITGAERRYASVEPVVLDRCEIRRFDPRAWKLFYDFDVLRQLEAEQATDLDRSLAGRLLSELNRFCNIWSAEEPDTWEAASELLAGLYAYRNGDYGHNLAAIGHAHIDTAWLWPVAETYRKCVRTFSSQATYMDEYPEYKFACSQAQHYSWIKDRSPDLYARIRTRVERGQFVPVGGTWIEPDCNIPSGESLVRQFQLGQAFFLREFGRRCREFWNPDVFGYNGQLPQIMRGAGIEWFLTQKLSWNAFNKPGHHTFLWQGIDGTRVLTHFPPADSYSGEADIAEIRRGVRDYKDHDRSCTSYLLFGHGDGGGGPTKGMLETLRRARDLQGVPRTTHRSSEEFFTELEREAADFPVLVGELYFEYHRGTYTSQAAVKRANRKGEYLLHDVELLAALAHWRNLQTYPAGELTRLWQILCRNQFHDILPGSSITQVYEDAHRDYEEIQQSGESLRAAALTALSSATTRDCPLNTIGFDRRRVTGAPDGSIVLVEAAPFSTGRVAEPREPVRIERIADGWVLENAHLRARLDEGGRLHSLVHKSSLREVLESAANVLEIYEDLPVAFDAWDVDPFHMETRTDCPPAHDSRVITDSELRAEIAFDHEVGRDSRGTQTVRLDADARRVEFDWVLDWNESHKMLKVRFPVRVHSPNATYEMQFGAVERPTHYTTSYDLARYEVPGHKWADLSEHDFGVALLTESKYGYSTFGHELRISLLRSPRYPDPVADVGRHRFQYAIYPHAGRWQEGAVIREAFDFNVPLLWANAMIETLFASDTSNLVLDTVKIAEQEDALVLRLYEAHGGRGRARLTIGITAGSVACVNLLEEETAKQVQFDGSVIELDYRPFEIITLLLRR
jgi:alpha-mannosidase